MAITLSQLCVNTEKTYGMKLLAGKDGMDNYVRWVHMVEDREVPGFLHGNELVFTTGIGQYGSSWIVDFVRKLREHNAAGVIVNIGPYINSVPSKAIVYCEENGFPIFTVPWEIHLIDITYDFCHRIVASEENEMSVVSAFKNLIFTPFDKQSYAHTLERRGFKNDSSYTIIACQMERDGKIETAQSWNEIKLIIRRVIGKRQLPLCVFVQENNLIIIMQKCSVQEAQALSEQLIKSISNQLENTVVNTGVSNVGEGYTGVVTSYKEATSALQVAIIKKQQILCYHEIGVYKILLGIDDFNILRDFMTGTLGILIDYDNKNNTNLVQTLECYLKNDGSVIEVADIMGVHRNTVNYKMKLIREILDSEMSTQDKVNLSLALDIYRILSL